MKALENARRTTLQTQILIMGFRVLSTSTLEVRLVKTPHPVSTESLIPNQHVKQYKDQIVTHITEGKVRVKRNLGLPSNVRAYHMKPIHLDFDEPESFEDQEMYESNMEERPFIIDRGTCCYLVMPFKLKNAGVTYQRLVNQIFKKKIGKMMEHVLTFHSNLNL